MRIHTRLVFDLTRDDLPVVYEEGYDYEGPVAQCKTSKEEKDLQKSQTALANQQLQFNEMQSKFYQTLMSGYEEQFASQKAILESIQKSWGPILEAGPGQEGFSRAQKTILNTQATEGTAAEYAKAKVAARESLAARGGVRSGEDEKLLAGIDTAGAADMASKRLALQEANYERGYQNWLNAANVLGGTAAMYNPAGMAGQATGAAGAYNQGISNVGDIYGKQADILRQQNQGGGFWGAVGGILGGAASAFTGGFGSALGTKMGGK